MLFTSKFHNVARILSPYLPSQQEVKTGKSRRRAFRPKDILSEAENKLFISRDPRKPNLSTSENFFATADISDPRSHFKVQMYWLDTRPSTVNYVSESLPSPHKTYQMSRWVWVILKQNLLSDEFSSPEMNRRRKKFMIIDLDLWRTGILGLWIIFSHDLV